MASKLYLNKCRKQIKDFEIRNVPRSKYEYNDLKEKSYWRCLIDEVEKLAKEKSQVSKCKRTDLWPVLPSKLRNRVAKFIHVPSETDLEEEEDYLTHADDIEEPKEIKRVHGAFNESTLSEVLEAERQYHEIKLRIDPKSEKRKKTHRNENWMADFMRKSKRDRIIWKSKYYKLEKSILEKSLFEQAEEIMDRAAGEFSDWVNGLTTTTDDALTKDLIKQLFSIEMTEGTSAAMHINPKEVKAVPGEIANRLNLPEMSIEQKVEQHLQEKRAKSKKKPARVAFGRTIPIGKREWIPSDVDRQLKPVFPEELHTKEILFKGISHLRSTKALVEHYLENENLNRPKYLVDIGSFAPQTKEESTEQIPLYERFRKRNL